MRPAKRAARPTAPPGSTTSFNSRKCKSDRDADFSIGRGDALRKHRLLMAKVEFRRGSRPSAHRRCAAFGPMGSRFPARSERA